MNFLLKKDTAVLNEKDPYALLSVREHEVLQRIVYGYSLSEIAQELPISVKTVETYKTRVDKLNIFPKRGLVDYALQYGLLTNPLSYNGKDLS